MNNSPQTPQSPKMKKPKKKRGSHAPSAYNLFVKAHYNSVRHLKRPQERMKELGKKWRKHKENGGDKSATTSVSKK